MPVSMSGEFSSFIVQGDYHDYGTLNVLQGTAPAGASQTKYVYVPPRPLSPRFTGQEAYLAKLRAYFGPPADDTSGRRSFLLYGMGGIGKTQIALKFAEENADRFWTFWIDAASSETLEQSVKAIADEPVAKAAGVERSTQSVFQWLSRLEHQWLLIFDNADGDPNTIGKYIPPGMRGNILFTSRNPMMRHHVSSPNARVEVDAMVEEQAISLLLNSAMLDEPSAEVVSLSRTIVKELCCLPLAVDQAGAAIASGLCSIHNYREIYAKRRKDLLTLPSFEGASNYGRAAYTTFEISYRAIRDCASGASGLIASQAAEIAIYLLEIFGYFHYEDISEDIIKRAAEAPLILNASTEFLRDLVPPEILQQDDSGGWDSLHFRTGIRVLCSFSLVKINASGNSYFVHPLVHSWIRDRMSHDTQQLKYRSASALMAHSIAPVRVLVEDFTFRRGLIPHLSAWELHRAELYQPALYMEHEFIRFALVYRGNGLLKEAEQLQLQVVKSMTRVHGAEHPDTINSNYALAETYCHQGRIMEAEKLLIQVLQCAKAVLGAEDSTTLKIMGFLAYVYRCQGQFAKAEQLQIRVLESMESVLGTEHPDTLTSMDSLASSYHRQGRNKEAEQLQLRVLESRRQVLGVDHPDTLGTMNGLAVTYSHQGRMAEAEELYIRVLESRKAVYGAEHPDTLTSMGYLAWVYKTQGRYEDAEQLQIQVLKSMKRVLGAEHPSTLVTMRYLALLWKKLGRDEEAIDLMLDTVDLHVKSLGTDHPHTMECTRTIEQWTG